jgi:hypothetical protein
MTKLVFHIKDPKAPIKKWDIHKGDVKIGEAVKSGAAWTISDLAGNRKTGMLSWCCIAIFDLTDLQEIVDENDKSLGL